MDILDIASEREEIARAAAIATNSKVSGPSPTGQCLYCDEAVQGQLRWCGVNCRDAWQHYSSRAQSH